MLSCVGRREAAKSAERHDFANRARGSAEARAKLCRPVRSSVECAVLINFNMKYLSNSRAFCKGFTTTAGSRGETISEAIVNARLLLYSEGVKKNKGIGIKGGVI